jgi:hypothetical protein
VRGEVVSDSRREVSWEVSRDLETMASLWGLLRRFDLSNSIRAKSSGSFVASAVDEAAEEEEDEVTEV